MSRLARLSAIALLLVGSLPAFADVKVTFRDGKVLEGRGVKQEHGLYLLELDTGNVLPIPTELVIQVELMVDEEPIPTGLTKAEPEILAGPPDGIELPTLADQLRVLRDSTSIFRPNIIDPYWQPTSDWKNTPEVNNNFNPARWYQAPIDPTWTPVDSRGEDVTNFNPARWFRAPIDSTWWPTDGFARRD
jgi:hypothetical protein